MHKPIPKPKRKKKKSKRLPQELYNEVMERFNCQCALCGWGGEGLQLHHIQGGNGNRKHELNNLIVLCYKCHAKAHSHPKEIKPKLIDIIDKKDE